MKSKKNLKLAAVLFAMIFVVGAAFAATNGVLAFGGTVRINNVAVIEDARLEFISTSIQCNYGLATSEIITGENGRQFLTFETVIDFCPTLDWPTAISHLNFTIQNTGNVPVRFENLLVGSFGFEMDVAIFNEEDVENSLFYTLSYSPGHPISTFVSDEIIMPGQILQGQLYYFPLNVNLGLPDDFEQIVRRNSFELSYTAASN